MEKDRWNYEKLENLAGPTKFQAKIVIIYPLWRFSRMTSKSSIPTLNSPTARVASTSKFQISKGEKQEFNSGENTAGLFQPLLFGAIRH